MEYVIVITNCLTDPTAHRTYHVVTAETAEEAHEIAKQQCYTKGVWGPAFREGEEVFVDRCLAREH